MTKRAPGYYKDRLLAYIAGVFVFAASVILVYYSDISSITRISSSFSDLFFEGRAWHFYEESMSVAVAEGDTSMLPFYSLTVYLTLAVLMLPLKIISLIAGTALPETIEITWVNYLIAFCAVLCYFRLEKILRAMGSGEKQARALSVYFLTTSFVLMGSVGFGQVDIFGLYLFLIAVHKYIKKDMKGFCLWFSLSFCFKGFAIFAFIPMILIIEKKPLKILKLMIFGLLIPVGIRLISGLMPGYKEVMEASLSSWNHPAKLWSVTLPFSYKPSALIVFFILVCLVSYLIKSQNPDTGLWADVACLSMSGLVLFTNFNTQWLIYVIPFFIISALNVRLNRFAYFMSLTLFNIGYAFSVIAKPFGYADWDPAVSSAPDNTDMVDFVINGMLRSFVTWKNPLRNLTSFLSDRGIPYSVLSAVLMAGTLCCLIVLVAERRSQEMPKTSEDTKEAVFINAFSIANLVLFTAYVTASVAMHL